MPKTITITIKTRGCGKRKKGGCYLVSEPSEDGILPLWTDIDPPIKYNGAQFRGTIQVDLESILVGSDNYLAGTSKERADNEKIAAVERRMFGMARRSRLQRGICRSGGLEALEHVHFKSIRRLGACLRSVARRAGGAEEIASAFRHLQEMNPQLVLADLWRYYNRASKKEKEKTAAWIRAAMVELNAAGDALEVT